MPLTALLLAALMFLVAVFSKSRRIRAMLFVSDTQFVIS